MLTNIVGKIHLILEQQSILFVALRRDLFELIFHLLTMFIVAFIQVIVPDVFLNTRDGNIIHIRSRLLHFGVFRSCSLFLR